MDSKPIFLVNCTFYDGCVEKACINLGITSCSQSDKQGAFNSGLSLVKTFLLDMWKNREGPMEKKLPKYQPEPPEADIPSPAEQPHLKLCSLVDGCLVLPRDVRTEWLTDPVRGAEWRQIVKEFDRCFAVAAQEAPGQLQDGSEAGQPAATTFSWDSVFPDEPKNKGSFEQKYRAHVKGKTQWSPQLTAYIVASPDTEGKLMLFLEASAEVTVPADEVCLAYGAGSWILDAKVDQYVSENPNGFKGVMCSFGSDTDLMVFEAGPKHFII